MNLFYQRDNRDKWVVDDRAFHRLGRLICTFPEIEVFSIKWSEVKSRDIEYPPSDMAAKDYDHLFKLLIMVPLLIIFLLFIILPYFIILARFLQFLLK